MSMYQNEHEDPSWSERWHPENLKEYKAAVFTRISELLIENFSKIKAALTKEQGQRRDLASLQKTIRDNIISVGIEDNKIEPIIIYQSDVDANYEDNAYFDTIIQYFKYAKPSHFTIEIIETSRDTGGTPSIALFLKADGKKLDINALSGITGLEKLKIKDNVSQFIEIPKIKTNINTTKLSEYIDTAFTEIKVKTE